MKTVVLGIIGVVIIAVSLGVLLSVGEYSFSDDSLLAVEKAYTVIVPLNYSINSKCELYYAFVEHAKNRNSNQLDLPSFAGMAPEDNGLIVEYIQAKFKGKDGIPSNEDDDDDYETNQEEIKEKIMTVLTDKIIITNDVNPKLKKDVRGLIDLMNTYNIGPIFQFIKTC